MSEQLPPPPRQLSSTARASVLLGGVAGTLGWIFLGLGLFFASFFALEADLWGLSNPDAEVVPGTGKVVAVEPTWWSEGARSRGVGKKILRVTVAYQGPDGARYQSRSYGPDLEVAVGDGVELDIPRADPAHAVIRGARRAPLPAAALWVLVIPAGAFLVVLFSLRGNLRRLHLLTRGELRQATLVSRRSTGVKVNGRIREHLTIAVSTAEGATEEATMTTHRTDLFEREGGAPILVDPRGGVEPALLEDLPVYTGPGNTLVPVSPGLAIFRIAWAGLVALGWVLVLAKALT